MAQGHFVKCSDRQPPQNGTYLVMRRGLRGRPSYEDKCLYLFGKWRNGRGVIIETVELWWEEGGEP